LHDEPRVVMLTTPGALCVAFLLHNKASACASVMPELDPVTIVPASAASPQASVRQRALKNFIVTSGYQ